MGDGEVCFMSAVLAAWPIMLRPGVSPRRTARASCPAIPRPRPKKRAQKEELAQWMIVRLENPDMFPAWVVIRKRYCSSTAST